LLARLKLVEPVELVELAWRQAPVAQPESARVLAQTQSEQELESALPERAQARALRAASQTSPPE
jgi:hypothetical protein